MRNIKFWCFMSVMILAVFAFSGCGGGSLDPQDDSASSEETSNENTDLAVPNDYPDTYDTARVLSGEWAIINETSDTANDITIEQGGTTVVLHFIASDVSFSNTEIAKNKEGNTGNSGTSHVKGVMKWFATITVPSSTIVGDTPVTTYDIYRETVSQDIDSDVNMIRAGKDTWRCSFNLNGEYGQRGTAMDIKILSATTMLADIQDTFSMDVSGVEGTLKFPYEKELYYRKK